MSHLPGAVPEVPKASENAANKPLQVEALPRVDRLLHVETMTYTVPWPQPWLQPLCPRLVDPSWLAHPKALLQATEAQTPWGDTVAQLQPAAAALEVPSRENRPNWAKNALTNWGICCQRQQVEGRDERAGPTATESTENQEQEQAVLRMSVWRSEEKRQLRYVSYISTDDVVLGRLAISHYCLSLLLIIVSTCFQHL
jgi:hypothetical protein